MTETKPRELTQAELDQVDDAAAETVNGTAPLRVPPGTDTPIDRLGVEPVASVGAAAPDAPPPSVGAQAEAHETAPAAITTGAAPATEAPGALPKGAGTSPLKPTEASAAQKPQARKRGRAASKQCSRGQTIKLRSQGSNVKTGFEPGSRPRPQAGTLQGT